MGLQRALASVETSVVKGLYASERKNGWDGGDGPVVFGVCLC